MIKFRFLLPALLLLGCASRMPEAKPVANFDAKKYEGKWYEVARLENSFERGCTNVEANYALRGGGELSVLNVCLKDGRFKTVNGSAKFVGANDIGELKVTFFWPFYGSYRVIYIDEAYNYAVVDGGSYDYLWILSRHKNPPKERIESLVKYAEERGFDPSNIILTKQTPETDPKIIQEKQTPEGKIK